MDIHEIINKIYPMPESSVDKLKRLLSKVTYPKGHLILETGKTETNLFFIEKGIARAYIPVDGKEVTFWIGQGRQHHRFIEKLREQPARI